MKKKPQYLTIFLLTASVLTGLVTGCGRAGNTTEAYAPYAAETAAAKSYAENVEYEVNADYQEAGAEPAASPLTSNTVIQPVNSNRKLIRTVNLSVETTEFNQLLANISSSIASFNGYIEQSSISGNSISSSYSNQRYASLIVRVPANHLDSFIAQVSEKENITNKSESAQDVTLQYTDIESRKKALNVEQERLWDLLAKAESIESVIALEQRLSEIRYQLETMESQLRTYDNQVDYSTVYLDISEVKIFTPTAPDTIGQRIQKGFSRNLENVITNLTNFFVWFISSLPSLILLTVIVVMIWFIVWFIQKNSKSKADPLYKKKFLPFTKRNKQNQQNQKQQNQDNNQD